MVAPGDGDPLDNRIKCLTRIQGEAAVVFRITGLTVDDAGGGIPARRPHGDIFAPE